MSFLRTMSSSIIALAATLLLAGTLHAADISMANGSVQFHTPDDWVDILDTQGDPEVHVFQVPDTSATGKVSLSRVTVTVKQVGDISGFQQYVEYLLREGACAARLQGSGGPAQTQYVCIHRAGKRRRQYSYSERYWLKDGNAIQLRCLRLGKRRRSGMEGCLRKGL